MLIEAKEQLAQYLTHQRRAFDLPLFFAGSEFQQAVWQELMQIPNGTTQSYKDLALSMDKLRQHT
ncbi:MAG: methylated-DNA-[protein]-cysteine S-methyltransferase [Bacteroidia bacterium]